MEILRLAFCALIGTSVMTSFSYMVAESFGKMYREPVLLGYLLGKLKLDISGRAKMRLGWLLHYGTGIAFVACFYPVWSNQGVTLVNTAILGATAGAAGILTWMFAFWLAPKPNIDFVGYYAQLFVAHVLFTLTAGFVWLATLCVSWNGQ